MFWGITLTYLLSVSPATLLAEPTLRHSHAQISPQCSESSRKVYGLLVLKQLERAAEITENVSQSSLGGPSDSD